jgi:hypothetical protein
VRDGEQQHPGTGVESLMPWLVRGMSQSGKPYQRDMGENANSPFMSWEGAPPTGTDREDALPRGLPARDYMANLYGRIDKSKQAKEWMKYLAAMGVK